ncbi:helix-turn-helix domain-containing protein [Pseudoteredinibacter isoporae]|uniref:helix-turn-helix domain-containing protein n=1 Tax=Pseudoteredinibacter isoporae TaxID=570281 RepID=UPI0031025183
MDTLLFNFHDLVLVGTTYQCLLFALLLLLSPNKNRVSQILLACFLLTQAFIPMDILVNFGAGFKSWALEASPDLFYAFGVAYWLEGPLLLWYTRSLLYKNYQFRVTDLRLLVPTLLYLVYIFLVFWSLSAEDQIMLIENSADDYPITHHAIYLFREVFRFSLGAYCLYELRKYSSAALNVHSDIEKIDFSWLRLLTSGFLILRAWAILVSLAIITSKEWFFPINYAFMGLLSNYVAFVLICALIFQSLSKASKLERLLEPESAENTTPSQEETKTCDFHENSEQLMAYMDSEKPFLKPSLTLEQLAKQMNWPQRNLSNTINRALDKNFFEFINEFRVNEATRQLRDGEISDKSITDIMLDSGFNSKATFNSYFKKITGTTPSQYRKQGQGNEGV